MPKRSLVCEKLLEEKGFTDQLEILEWKVDFFPLDEDLLSMEASGNFKAIYADNNLSSIFNGAKGIAAIQAAFGLIPRICGKGPLSKQLYELIVKMKVELPDKNVSDCIDSLVILERSCDFSTPFLMQLTYEGLLDETFGVHQSHIQVDSSISGQKDLKKLLLHSSDLLYSEVRDKNFSNVGLTLNKIARKLNDDYEERHQAKTVLQIRQFIGKLGTLQSEHKSLQIHTNIAEHILKISKEMDFLKELETQQSEFLFLISDIIAGQESNSCMETLELMIERHAPLESVLRIFILFCLENGGMKTKSYEAIKKDIIQTYGFRHLITLANLEKASLIHSNSTAPKINKAQLRRALFLISEDIIEDQDVSYAYSGYTPSSVRIIQSLLGIRAKGTFDLRNIRNIDDSLKPWLSDMFDEYQGIAKSDEEKKIILIYFIGGCTFAEISCLRFLESLTDRKFVVLTDEIVNGKSLVKSFYPSQQ